MSLIALTALFGVLAAAVLLVWILARPPAPSKSVAFPATPSSPAVPEPPSPVLPLAFAAYAGSASCRECHEQAYALWADSNHALAERDLNPDLDNEAFAPERSFKHGTQTTEIRQVDGRPEVVTAGFGGRREAYPVARVLGHDPLRQYLVPGPRGRFQMLEAAWDPHRQEWFNVYGEEDRQPGEWGHWTGRGMNWNNMCAVCHNTRFLKNYDERTDTYHSTMAEMSVGCEACHGPMKDHVQWSRAHPDSEEKDPTLKTMNPYQILDTCATCHSRRGDLTGDFMPGDPYYDHYALTIVDETERYYPDGQVLDEDYVFASFLSSKMHAAGVRCLDCHDPHSIQNIHQGNDRCMRCHNGGYANSPIIDPAAHGHHKLDDKGGECVGCHMPHTTYMQRHPRRDHGFTIPDPLLTQELGIPNACNRCHDDQDTAWSLKYTEEWYGDRMNRPARERTRWIAAARRGDPDAWKPLVILCDGNEIPYWQASAARLLRSYTRHPQVLEVLERCLEHPDALVRANAAFALDPLVSNQSHRLRPAFRQLLNDPLRWVRINAAWALRSDLNIDSKAGEELVHYLRHNADQPTGQLQLGVFALDRHNIPRALEHMEKAVSWDPNSAPLREEYAVVLSMAERFPEALREMQEACRLAPEEPEYHYRLALAWNETGRLDRTLEELEQTVKLAPDHARAWYNLGLARNTVGLTDSAILALLQGENADPRDPRIPYARATILAQLGRTQEARAAAERALEILPEFEAARSLLQQLDR